MGTGFSLLYRRNGVYRFRRFVPAPLREIIGRREVKVSLRTTDPDVAKRRAAVEALKADRLFEEARRTLANPSALAFRLIQKDAEDRRRRPRTDEEREAESLALTEALRREVDPVRIKALQAALKGRETADGGLFDSAENPLLSVVLDRWREERKPPTKTWEEWRTAIRRFQQMALGGADAPVREITKAHVRMFKDGLLAMPARRRLAADGGAAKVSPATVAKNLNALRSVLSYAVGQGYLDVNPADGITVAGAKRRAQESRRLPYDAEDLKKLFAVRREGANYWLSVLGLYTGARLEELGQLRTDDVKEADGVPYLFIRAGEGRRVKTGSSERRIPLHPELVRLGFLAFVDERRRARAERLFDLRLDAHGTLTGAWSKWWGRHARKVCGITDRRKTFHSFRHAWVDAAREVMSEEHRHAITGHSGGGVGRSYGTSVPLRVLAESMAGVRFGGVGDV